MISTKENLRFLLLQVISPHYHQDIALANMLELEQLVTTFGGEIVIKSIQHRPKPHPATYIGEGKVEWVKSMVKEHTIDVVVLNDVVNSGQLFRLEKALWEVNTRIGVWDRIDLILHIFDKHAASTEAKLQIELARIEHIGPRIYGLGGTVLSRQGGGIGTRGKGETNSEMEHRVIKNVQQKIQKQIEQRTQLQRDRMNDRRRRGVYTAALVGYTSAGKTTLFNTLTKKHKQTNTGLFTTLDSLVGKVKLGSFPPEVILSDTIGFIDNLPPALIQSFRSTLLESLEATVLLHVVDAADPHMQHKIEVVETILQELGVEDPPILVLNKIDRVSNPEIFTEHFASRKMVKVSATTEEGLTDLKQLISATLRAAVPAPHYASLTQSVEQAGDL